MAGIMPENFMEGDGNESDDQRDEALRVLRNTGRTLLQQLIAYTVKFTGQLAHSI